MTTSAPKPKKKSPAQIWQDLLELLISGEKEKIEEMFTTASELNFDLTKKLKPWEKALPNLTVDTLAEFFSIKEVKLPTAKDILLYPHAEEIHIQNKLWDGAVRKLPKGLLKFTQLKKLTIDVVKDGAELLDLTQIASLEEIIIREITEASHEGIKNVVKFNLQEKLKIDCYNYTGGRPVYLSSGDQRTLPNEIGDFTGLKKIEIGSNNLPYIPETIGNLTSLEELSVRFNYKNLKELPETIGNLTKLQLLEAACNSLSELPESIGNLSELKSLSLYNNQLESLPETIGNLKSLTRTSLNGNKLSTLPDTITELHNLEYIGLAENNFTTIPHCLSELQSLEALDIKGNPIEALPKWLHENTSIRLDVNREDYSIAE